MNDADLNKSQKFVRIFEIVQRRVTENVDEVQRLLRK